MPSKRKKTDQPTPDKTAPVDNVEQIISTHYANTGGARRYLIFGVVIFLIAIGVLWIWALKIKITNASWKRTTDGQLIQSTAKNWEQIFTDTKNAQDAKQKVKQQLKNILEQLSTTSTTSTATPGATSTSSTIN